MTANILLNMTRRFGHSNPRSRQAVIKAHDGEANARAAARMWAELYHIHGDGDEVWLAYISLVDLGYRIGCHKPDQPNVPGKPVPDEQGLQRERHLSKTLFPPIRWRGAGVRQ